MSYPSDYRGATLRGRAGNAAATFTDEAADAADTTPPKLVRGETGCRLSRSVEFIQVIAELEQNTVLDPGERDGVTMTRIEKPEDGSSDLADVVRSYRLPPDTYVWGAGETEVMSNIRTHLRDCATFNPRQMSIVGYWQRAPA